jgi:hypothetical protein
MYRTAEYRVVLPGQDAIIPSFDNGTECDQLPLPKVSDTFCLPLLKALGYNLTIL